MKGLTSVTTALPAEDLDRARAFYSGTLGLDDPELVENDNGLLYTAGDTQFLVFVSAGKPSGTHTQMAFHVDDADAAAADMRGNGVSFEEVEGLDQVDGIADLGAARGGWFKDSEGNMLGLVQELT